MKNLKLIASKLKQLAEDESSEELMEAEDESEEDLVEANEGDSQTWYINLEHDSPTDPTVMDVGYRGPHPYMTDRRRFRITLDNTKPPRAVKR